ncbi:relaxase/mobilization nuclease domain-containing protein [Thermoleptolyngbya oregonensis NK1-22]|uniref:Relaxase/mobilization nuclease domain-containing protein n=1 Tax=Thermoleptolyngbya oregonensis NK1-22 TaxID=2547457 RepID=A0AA96YSC1_9CYAN|nr:relaxase/mobilization nuclease domain-containing protein [Thermoleptolyngbya oregonensis NK1-22]
MAIAKISRGNGFRGVLDYCFSDRDWQEQKRATEPALIGGNMAGKTPRELAAEFGIVRRIASQRVKNPVWHVSLSLPHGECLTPEQWRDFAREFIARMGDCARQHGETGICPDLNQWCLVHHPGSPNPNGALGTHAHDHVHLVLNRTNLEGKTAKLRNDHLDAQRVLRELEREFGLTPVPNSPVLDPDPEQRRRARRERRERKRRNITRGELAWAARLTRQGKPMPDHLREKVKAYFESRQSRQSRQSREPVEPLSR